MSDITRYHERKISLLDMFSSGGVSERVFKKLYDEYANKVEELLGLHSRKLDELKTEYEGKGKRLDDIKMTIEELEVRHKIGEVGSQKFNERIGRDKASKRFEGAQDEHRPPQENVR
jgi:archaellum component FlaC